MVFAFGKCSVQYTRCSENFLLSCDHPLGSRCKPWLPLVRPSLLCLSHIMTEASCQLERHAEFLQIADLFHSALSLYCSVMADGRVSCCLNDVCRKELALLIAEQQRATELAMEKEEELYRLHESHLAEIAAQRRHLDRLKTKHKAERDAAWRDIDQQRQMMIGEQQSNG